MPAASTELMPSVAMNELTRSLTTSRPLTAPINAPMPTTAMLASNGLQCALTMSAPSTTTAKPMTAAIERSNWSAASGSTRPSATIAEMASLDRMMRAFWLVANVSGSSTENSATTPSQTMTAPYALSLNLRALRGFSAGGAAGGAVAWLLMTSSLAAGSVETGTVSTGSGAVATPEV